MSNMLQGKRAAVFGAGGSIGAAVAREFAAEGKPRARSAWPRGVLDCWSH